MQAPPLCQSMDTLGETFHITYIYIFARLLLCKESNMDAWFEEKCINVDFDQLSV